MGYFPEHRPALTHQFNRGFRTPDYLTLAVPRLSKMGPNSVPRLTQYPKFPVTPPPSLSEDVVDRPAASGIRDMEPRVDLGADLAADDNVAIQYHRALAKTVSTLPSKTSPSPVPRKLRRSTTRPRYDSVSPTSRHAILLPPPHICACSLTRFNDASINPWVRCTPSSDGPESGLCSRVR